MPRLPVLVLPSHGHAPYLLGAAVALGGGHAVCLPEFYGATQRGILREEFRGREHLVWTSSELGRILEPLLFDARRHSSFQEFAAAMVQRVDGIERDLAELLRCGVPATSLTGEHRLLKRFEYVLNCGLPLAADVAPVYFVFAAKMSELYRCTQGAHPGLVTLETRWRAIEGTFSGLFVPRLNSLSYTQSEDAGVTFTPPFATPMPIPRAGLDRPSLLLVASGTGWRLEEMLRLARSGDLPFVTLPSAPPCLQFPRVSAGIYGDRQLLGVVARCGLGAVWRAVVNEKPLGTLVAGEDEDPEIQHNIRSVVALGVGVLLSESIQPLLDGAARCREAARRFLADCDREFGTLGGLAFVASRLAGSRRRVVARPV
ncbi:MAG: hypothetical protein HYZ53_29505 [Planctomycetes bacterium]|nr:hypothetical protein [Planctomycetota bacterium]